MWQTTLNESFTLNGIGVHGGEFCSVTVRPAEENTGIIFIRDDDSKPIPACYKNVSNAVMCTQLSNGNEGTLKTVEHLMAALYGCGVSNALIDVKGVEIPILDGSALEFVKEIKRVGIKKQSAVRPILKVLKKIRVTEGSKYEELVPADTFSVNVTCDFEAKGLKTAPEYFEFSENESAAEKFAGQIAPARTFGFIADVEYIKKNNLAKGASLKNTVVYDNTGIPMNDEGLRFENEAVKHKLLDAVGDMALSQYWIHGQLNCFCPSHQMNNMLLRVLFSGSENYMIVDQE